MSASEDTSDSQDATFVDVVASLQQGFAKRLDFERVVSSQQITIQLNGVAREQKRAIESAIRQIRAAKALGLSIDIEKLLLSASKSKKLMSVWTEAVLESDLEKAEHFKEECQAWADFVSKSIDRTWRDECELATQSMSRHAGLLKTLKKFSQFEIEYSSHCDRLQMRMQSHAFHTRPAEMEETRKFIEQLEEEINNLGSLPDGLLEFMDQVTSTDGVSLTDYLGIAPQQVAIRRWLDDNNFMGQLVVKVRA